MKRLLATLAFVAACGLARAQPASPTVPPEITGHWVIRDAIGEAPMLLEVSSAKALVGRHVDIGRELHLWTVFSGTIVALTRKEGSLRDYIAGATASPPAEVAQGDRAFVFYEIGTTPCSSHGKRLDGCPIFTIAADPKTGEVALVTLPSGLATLRREPRGYAKPR